MTNLRNQEPNAGASRSSERATECRNRKRTICNIIHNTTWVAESATLVSCVVFQLLAIHVDPYIVNSVNDTISALIFWRIIAPYTHLFNEQRIKIIILEKGWIKAMLAALHYNVVLEEPATIPITQNDSSSTAINRRTDMNAQESGPIWKNKRNDRNNENRVNISIIEKNLHYSSTKQVLDPNLVQQTLDLEMNLPNMVNAD